MGKQTIEVPNFLKKTKTKKRTKLTNAASRISNTYPALHPELGINFVLPNSYLNFTDDETPNKEGDIIMKILGLPEAYAIHTYKENKFKLLEADKAYMACSYVLQCNRGIMNSRSRTSRTQAKLKTALDVFLYYRDELHGRYRKLKK